MNNLIKTTVSTTVASEHLGYFLPELLLSILIYLTVILGCTISMAPLLLHNALKPEAKRLELALRRLNLASSHYESDIIFRCLDKKCLANIRGNNTLILQHFFSDKVDLNLKSAQSNQVVFYNTGAVSPATFTLKEAFKTCSIIISLRGRIRSTC